ncbi:MAG TPA: LPS export ABC transporter periplasmic protein LptC [Desulfobacteraceae bacterium]|nr:LPS export ABC transporter periplasmic protein LptC [Desulfobacteraceae bacterium]
MLYHRYVKKIKIKFLLLFFPFIFLCAIIIIFMGRRDITKEPEKLISSIPENADIFIGKIYHEAAKNGKKEWTLTADAGYYGKIGKQLVLKGLFVMFFLKDGARISLTAEKGVLNTDSNDLKVTNNVVVESKNYKVFTDRLHYDHNKRMIITETTVKIESESVCFAASGMTVTLDKKRLQLDGNVSGVFNDKMILNSKL